MGYYDKHKELCNYAKTLVQGYHGAIAKGYHIDEVLIGGGTIDQLTRISDPYFSYIIQRLARLVRDGGYRLLTEDLLAEHEISLSSIKMIFYLLPEKLTKITLNHWKY